MIQWRDYTDFIFSEIEVGDRKKKKKIKCGIFHRRLNKAKFSIFSGKWKNVNIYKFSLRNI